MTARAERLFETFHQFEPVKIGEFGPRFEIPRQAYYVGEAKTMFYTSDKLNPTTGEDEGWLNYYHEHKVGVRTYLTGDEQGGEVRNIPRWIHNTQALSRIGDCDGFDFTNFEGEKVEAQSTGTKPEWYATPSGKALLVVQSKNRVIAIVWGGVLNVEDRGVVG